MLNNVDLNTVSDKIIQLALTNNTPKIYISGPVSMYKDDNYALRKFIDKANEIESHINNGRTFNNGKLKFEYCCPLIVNPVSINMSLKGIKEMDWGDFMAYDLLILNQCNYIYMMDDWEKSDGAKMEKLFAERSGRIKEIIMD